MRQIRNDTIGTWQRTQMFKRDFGRSGQSKTLFKKVRNDNPATRNDPLFLFKTSDLLRFLP